MFGYLSDPPSAKDYRWSLLAKELPPAADSDILLPERTAISNQGPYPTCVGNAVADGFEIVLPGPARNLSRRFAFQMACFEAGLDGRTGVYIRSAMDAGRTHGLVEEDVYPYGDPFDPVTGAVLLPPIGALRNANRHKVQGFYRIDEFGAARLDAIDVALQRGLPVVFGTDVGLTFQEYRSGVLEPSGVAGHALVVVGRLLGADGRRIYRIRNSWGTGWGDRGYALFSEDYMTWNRTQDLWVLTAGPVLG
jgi:hypothetical protein